VHPKHRLSADPGVELVQLKENVIMLALRLPLSVAWGALVAVALFSLLWRFVNVPMDVGNLVQATRIEFTRKIVETPLEEKRPEKVVREAPPLTVEPPPFGVGVGSADPPTPYAPPDVRVGGVTLGPMPAGSDRDALPLVRVNPDYPPRALANGIEGWVQVQFTITTAGTVKDPKVVEADPDGYFEKAALNAVSRYKYKPKIVDGEPVERPGINLVISFTLKK
jgi:protein TonB